MHLERNNKILQRPVCYLHCISIRTSVPLAGAYHLGAKGAENITQHLKNVAGQSYRQDIGTALTGNLMRTWIQSDDTGRLAFAGRELSAYGTRCRCFCVHHVNPPIDSMTDLNAIMSSCNGFWCFYQDLIVALQLATASPQCRELGASSQLHHATSMESLQRHNTLPRDRHTPRQWCRRRNHPD